MAGSVSEEADIRFLLMRDGLDPTFFETLERESSYP